LASIPWAEREKNKIMLSKVGHGKFADSFDPGEIEQIPFSDLNALDRRCILRLIK